MIFIRLFFGCLTELMPLAVLFFYSFDGRYRLSKKKTFLITALFLTVLSLLFVISGTICSVLLPGTWLYWLIMNISLFTCTILSFVWYYYTIDDIWQKKIFVFSFILIYDLTVVFICDCFLNYVYLRYLYIEGTSDGLLYFGPTIPALLGSTAIVLPLYLLLIKHFFLPVRDGLEQKESGYLSFMSLFLLILLAGISFVNADNLFASSTALFLYAALLAVTFVIYIVIFRMLYLSNARHLLQQENIQSQHQIALRDEQYHRITETIQSTRRLRHDIKHHILTVHGLLAEGNTAKAETYLNEYLDTVKKYDVVNFCGNSIINLIVSHYYTLAKENQIDFSVRINIPKELSIQDSDLSVLLGNLLENAVTATAAASENRREIRLNIIVAGTSLVITVDNGFDGTITYQNEEYFSIKPEHTGLGLKSITNIANKYNGAVEFTHEDTVFHSSIMLEIEKKPYGA